MKTARATRRLVLAGALGLTLVAVWFAPDAASDEKVVGAAPRQDGPASAAQLRVRRAVALIDVLAIRPRATAMTGEESSLFTSTRWDLPAVPPPAAAPIAEPVPAAPVAPPLPFRVIGSFMRGGEVVVFLQQNEQSHAVRVGDTIGDINGDTYKVEGLDGTALKLRYLPLDQIQTLELGRTFQEK